MPFIGELNDLKVTPEEVDDDTDVFCPECGDRMHTWGPGVDGTARHFQHYLVENCSGESDLHKKLKSVAVSGLRGLFDDGCRYVVEQPLAAPHSDKQQRHADAYVEFVYDADWQFFDGLAVEVQYKNKAKDKAAVVGDYAAQGVATVFVTPEDFNNPQSAGTSLALDESELRARARRTACRYIFGTSPGPSRRLADAISVIEERDGVSLAHAPVPDAWIKMARGWNRSHHRYNIGAQQYIDEVRSVPKKAVVPAEIPSEQFVFDLIYRLDENNAPRRCATCGEAATTYYFIDDSISQFRCERHLLDADSIAGRTRDDEPADATEAVKP